MSEQGKLGLNVDEKIKSVEDFKFETSSNPIKGFPELHWRGKRPFTSTQFYPAQLKENHGEEVNGWMNKIFWGDNLQVMSHLLKEYRGQVDLIYIDPPFDSKADYKKKIQIKGKSVLNDSTAFEEKQYTDIWNNDEYLQFMYERLILLRELLSDTGSIYLHCDWHKSHYLRIIMDEIFGNNNFKNEITWKRKTGTANSKNSFGNQTDTILYYVKSENYSFNLLYRKNISEDEINEKFNLIDGNGKRYWSGDLGSPNPRENLKYIYKGYNPPSNGWAVSLEIMKKWDEQGKLIFPKNMEGRIRRKMYLEDWLGFPVQNLWDDISPVQPQAKEKEDYPTQKPEKLLERILLSSSNEGDLIFDCFMGSGTTQVTAMKLGRRFIGADINLGAIQTTTKRLLNIAKELNGQLQDEPKYTGFSVYNVNHYDVFRNPLEAKDLLIKALEIQPLPNNSIYDGEKDGRMVKIMPINRIATRADLSELISNFDYKAFEKIQEQSPTKKAVEHLLLVCMGHEPDLAAALQSAVPYKLDIEVVDILRDKANLEFKRDSETEIVIEGGQLLIREFYPMNLLQKLSLAQEDVENWKELVESVMIDFNYDGSVFEPQVVDVPEGNNLVKGVYNIPANAGTIRVKITDLLSESLETTIKNN